MEGIPGDAHVLKGGLVVGPGGVGDGVGLGLLILGELLAQLLELGLQVVGAVEVVQGPVFDPLLGRLAVHLAVQHLRVGGDLHGGLVVGGGQVVDVAADGHGVVAQLGGPGVVLAVAAGEAEAQGQSQGQKALECLVLHVSSLSNFVVFAGNAKHYTAIPRGCPAGSVKSAKRRGSGPPPWPAAPPRAPPGAPCPPA